MIVSREVRPLLPDQVIVNSVMYGSAIPAAGVDIVFSWKNRNRLTQPQVIGDSVPTTMLEDGVTTTVKVYDATGTLLSTYATITGVTWTHTSALQTADGSASQTGLTYVFSTIRLTYSSYTALVLNVARPSGIVPTNNPTHTPSGTVPAPTPTSSGGSMVIREIDGTPSVVTTVLEVGNGQLTDVGGGISRLTVLNGTNGTNGTNGANGANGTNGTNGVAGSVWHNGVAVPANSLGVNGDYYLRTNSDVYQKASSVWSVIANIKGADGVNSLVRATATVLTGTLANSATANVSIDVGKLGTIFTVETSAACWVRGYSSASRRTNDSSRLQTAKPTGEHGVMFEVTTIVSDLLIEGYPPADYFNYESTPTNMMPLAITNQSGASANITITITYVKFE